MNRRHFTALLALTLVASLTVACGKDAGSSTTFPDLTEDAGDAAVPEVSIPDADPDPIPIVEACGDAWPEEWEAFELALLDLINEVRAAGGNCTIDGMETEMAPASAWTLDPVLWGVARCHSLDMEKNTFYAHEGSDGRHLRDQATDTGFEGAIYAVDLGKDYTSPEETLAGWLSNGPSCQILFDPDDSLIGLGYVAAQNGGHLWTRLQGRPAPPMP